MKALLDTHTFLWAITNDAKMSRRAQQVFTGPNDLWLSAASVWEIILKGQRGRLPLPTPVGPYILKKLSENNIEILPIGLDHVLLLESLPLHHSDPFDRIMIAQSMHEKLPLVSADSLFASYEVEVIW